MAVSTWTENPVALINFKSCQTLNIVGILFTGRNLLFKLFQNWFTSGVQTETVCI